MAEIYTSVFNLLIFLFVFLFCLFSSNSVFQMIHTCKMLPNLNDEWLVFNQVLYDV